MAFLFELFDVLKYEILIITQVELRRQLHICTPAEEIENRPRRLRNYDPYGRHVRLI